ncbi:chaplin [Kitasatospora sp. NE20-6]|uniref:chaplin n=1 Tax=Kitasatospora sp. NE20-6 TaxID=2859066 RepID=UPI0038B37221
MNSDHQMNQGSQLRQVAKRGILTAVATGSVLASTGGFAYAAGSEAQGVAANSPGVGSGNSVQAPVDIPVNACGNTVNVIGLLNPAYGNQCGNVSTGHGPGRGAAGGHSDGTHAGGSQSRPVVDSSTTGGATAGGGSHGSPGVVSGNTVSVPVTAPVNACGNTVDVVGLGNPAFGNQCGSHSHPAPPAPPEEECDEPPHTPPPTTGGEHLPPSNGTPRSGDDVEQTVVTRPVAAPDHLASTGASGLGLIGPVGAALLIGGGVLYRRSRAGAR